MILSSGNQDKLWLDVPLGFSTDFAFLTITWKLKYFFLLLVVSRDDGTQSQVSATPVSNNVCIEGQFVIFYLLHKSNLYALTSVCIFSIMYSVHYPKSTFSEG